MILWTIGAALAAPCDGHALFTQGTTMTMTHYNRKGKMVSTVVSENREVRSDGTAQIHGETTDKKGRDVMAIDYDVRCADDTLSIHMTAYLPPETMAPYGDEYEVQFDSTELQFPSGLAVGQELPDASVVAHLTMKGGEPSPLTKVQVQVQVVDREVVAQESVTTPAGTFDAWKITSSSVITTQSVINVVIRATATEWYVPDVGVVRSESFRPNGKPAGHAELTALQAGN